MHMRFIFLFILCILIFSGKKKDDQSWIRINQLGYPTNSVKVAVWCSKDKAAIKTFQLIDAVSKKNVLTADAGKEYGVYGPFTQTYRLNFSKFKTPGKYYLLVGDVKSPEFNIADDVYKGSADFCLRYMRQQRSGFNPFLKDSCHTHDGYVLYGQKKGIKDSTYIDVVGGWHDASDYLQYSTTSANATYHLLMAYRDFKNVFTDRKLANGLDGKNNILDVLDEAKWGLDWLLKMHPRDDWMFNQLADDRDHMGMRIPKMDSFYGKGYQRPVYFINGEPQQRGKFLNNTNGTSSTAAKFSSAFSLGSELFSDIDSLYKKQLKAKALSAYLFALQKPGWTQTASVRSPYIYAEQNWVDDMELASAGLSRNTEVQNRSNMLSSAMGYAIKEPITPWIGNDTANHYQWYPFINLGHYELAKFLKGEQRDTIIGYYKEGIESVWKKAKQNAFYRGVPYIWCSNNLTTSFAIQCYWYRELTGDQSFSELEQANIDLLFGCNPWGTSMVYGLPAWGDTPVDPHSAFTHLKNYPIDGGLVDGPVYGSIYKNLIGIKLKDADEYEEFQSNVAVYHDDYGDYSTNEPTMDGTASLIYLLASREAEAASKSTASGGETSKDSTNPKFLYDHGAIVRGDSTKKQIALVFTGHEFAEGGEFITKTLADNKIKASFFLTGRFYENPAFKDIILKLQSDGHYLGPHSYNHLLYCDWRKRDSLLVTKQAFDFDLAKNVFAMSKFNLSYLTKNSYFLPPYEWYNNKITEWTKRNDMQLINYTPGTFSHADYTIPVASNYRSSEEIYKSITQYEKTHPSGLNGFMLLMHIGAGPGRADKFHNNLPQLIRYLKGKGYQFQTVEQLLSTD